MERHMSLSGDQISGMQSERYASASASMQLLPHGMRCYGF